MTEEVAKKASKLLEKKSVLLKDLSYLTSPDQNIFIAHCHKDAYISYHMGMINYDFNSYPQITEKVKELVIIEVKDKIREIEDELLNLQC